MLRSVGITIPTKGERRLSLPIYQPHRAHLPSLAITASAVNPVVAAMPEVGDCLATEQSIVTGLSAALDRWRAGEVLTAEEMDMAEEVYGRLCEVVKIHSTRNPESNFDLGFCGRIDDLGIHTMAKICNWKNRVDSQRQ